MERRNKPKLKRNCSQVDINSNHQYKEISPLRRYTQVNKLRINYLHSEDIRDQVTMWTRHFCQSLKTSLMDSYLKLFKKITDHYDPPSNSRKKMQYPLSKRTEQRLIPSDIIHERCWKKHHGQSSSQHPGSKKYY